MSFVDRVDQKVTKYRTGIRLVSIMVKYKIGIDVDSVHLLEWSM